MATIVIIDDSVPFREIVRQILVKDGHEIYEANDGTVVLKLLEKHTPDLVITDIFMPNKDGIEVVREVRRVAPNTKIIAMTGSNPVREQLYLTAASELGADATIKKPFRSNELRTIVRKLLAEQSADAKHH